VTRWLQICAVVLHGSSDAANPYHQNEPTKLCRRSALWEYNLQRFHNQLHPGIFLDGQQRDDFRASGHNDGNDSSSSGIHDEIASTASLLSDFQLDQPLLVIKDTIVDLSNLFFKLDLIL